MIAAKQHVMQLPTRNDALAIGVLMRLMSSATTTQAPELPLYRVRGAAEAYELAAVAYDTRRTRQLVLMSPHRSGWLLDPVDVAIAVGDHADVVMIDDSRTAYDVDAAITKSFAVFGGGVRVLRPGMTEADERRHRLVKIRDAEGNEGLDPDAALEGIERIVAEGLREPRRVFAEHATQGEIRAAVKQAVAEEQARNRELTSKLATSRRALEKLQAELDAEERPVYADPHAQFRYDLHRYWLKATEEGDRPEWPLREWELGVLFLDSIAEQQIVDRPRVMRAVVDVITGRHKEINSRASRNMRTSISGNAPAVTREDGAVAWRCSINLGPAAARLMWWEGRPDGVVELSRVATHDDTWIA